MKEMGGGGCGEFRAVQELTGAMQEAFLYSGHFIVRGPEGRLPLSLALSVGGQRNAETKTFRP